MPHFQWPLTRNKPKTFEDQLLDKEMQTKAGLAEVKGTSFLKYRVEAADESVGTICNMKIADLKSLKKRHSSEVLDAKIGKLEKEIQLWLFYKDFKRAAAPFAGSGDDHGMSERIRATELLFFRSLDKPENWPLAMILLQYVSDICYKLEHSRVPPVLLIQTPVMKGGYMGDANADIDNVRKTED